ncbi:MAG: LD-carboxypeptidase [Lachnospiraceae bacterium]|nr:LD-carboxypeptidase [Lachnospiraceae bacterium]
MNTLKQGDTIGIICPSCVADKNDYEKYKRGIEKLGFKAKLGKNIYKDTDRYTASVEERVNDLNEMVYDEAVKMIFFDGGCGSVDLIPYIDYKQIKKTPKLFLSFSDGTSILNAVYAQTGITTYYGQTPILLGHISEYDRKQFVSHLVEGNVTDYISNSDWHTITEGCCRGSLVGGYLLNFALALGNRFFPYQTDKKYILFIEELAQFRDIEHVSMLLTCIGQSRLMERVTGLLFGHYSKEPSPLLFEVLERFGKKYNIPVAYCDDFGHGLNHAIFPIGKEAFLDTKNKALLFQ